MKKLLHTLAFSLIAFLIFCSCSEEEGSINKNLDSIDQDQSDLLKKIENKDIKDMLKKLTSDAFEKDIFGAPTFVINNKIFWGQDRLDYALEEYYS